MLPFQVSKARFHSTKDKASLLRELAKLRHKHHYDRRKEGSPNYYLDCVLVRNEPSSQAGSSTCTERTPDDVYATKSTDQPRSGPSIRQNAVRPHSCATNCIAVELLKSDHCDIQTDDNDTWRRTDQRTDRTSGLSTYDRSVDSPKNLSSVQHHPTR